MSLSTQDVFDAALGLPADRRAELADRLLSSLEDPVDPEIVKAWAEEADRRMEALRQGRVKAVSGEEGMAQIRGGYAIRGNKLQ
jgi:putative addiction module component (TIGR02574 family)